jgi:hypothetical protein
MRTVLICHESEEFNRELVARWLASFSNLAGILLLKETRRQKLRRIRRQLRWVGVARFLDVLAFRIYYVLFRAAADHEWERATIDRLSARFKPIPAATPLLVTTSPNTAEAVAFLRSLAPDIVMARCKALLKEAVFTIPSKGTLVMHPGICPEYRNAHGCFWALTNHDLQRVGMTLLKIDRGVDTGPVYGYFYCDYDPRSDSHIVIQHRTVCDNFDRIREKIEEIGRAAAVPVDTAGRTSAAWGQPWLTRYLRWKWTARRRSAAL